MKKPGCGNAAHHMTCLCDVNVDKPLPINPQLSAGWFVPEVMKHFGHSAPFKNLSLLAFFEDWVATHDEYLLRLSGGAGPKLGRPLSHEPWRVDARNQVLEASEAGKRYSPARLRDYVAEKHGINLSRSGASHFVCRTLWQESKGKLEGAA